MPIKKYEIISNGTVIKTCYSSLDLRRWKNIYGMQGVSYTVIEKDLF